MISAFLNTALPLSFSSSSRSVKLTNHNDPGPKRTKLKFIINQERKFAFMPLKCIWNSDLEWNARNHSFCVSCLTATEVPLGSSEVVADRLGRVVSEFRSLTEPIDRVKRLLHYAALLPPVDESVRSQENRVAGCATQVWVEAELDELGRVRFGADSDSEISKGFCSCLIHLLDGAEPEEVAKVKPEDLADLNVGLHGKAHSRVITWHNVLIAMQKRTAALVAGSERERSPPLEQSFPSSLVATAEAQIPQSRWQKLDANLSRS
ncbi:sufE-like protein 2, chloroplastic [Corylus avellana]|uniref:sufE-like protein 2, chloroplastic n=1 Tax=Corylus avellana TaxID=13451 RepID=UPI00286BBF59|nr:sufE-like protein 2, chloroplastic [Corylus avellana]XP_059447717.1 sufE-like protein 2, chloroplastic [Corylus avellana]